MTFNAPMFKFFDMSVHVKTLPQWLSERKGVLLEVITGSDGRHKAIALYDKQRNQFYVTGYITDEIPQKAD